MQNRIILNSTERNDILMLLRQIDYLQAVVECGNFYIAAEKCHVSQSAISQQIKKLEDELGVKLLSRHNRTFTLTPAGEHFYRKSLIILNDVNQLIRETQRIDSNDSFVLRLGCYKGYHGNEFSKAISIFSEKYPKINVQVMLGSHEELYRAMENSTIDLSLNDQRRAFSNTYNNIILSESNTYIEISARNPLSHLEQLDVKELKNTPCIILINAASRQEEQEYYNKIVGLHGDFLFADSLQEARLMLITGQGYMPVDVIGEQKWSDSVVKRVRLMRNNEPITKTYCAFWKKENSNCYIEAFAKILKETF